MLRLALREPCRDTLLRSLRQQGYNPSRSSSSSGLPPNTRQAGFGKILFFLTPIAAAGGVITYANYDKAFRKTVEESVPGAAAVIKVALQEEKPFAKQIESVTKQFDELTKSFDSAKSTIGGLFGSSEPNKEQERDELKSKLKPKTTPVTKVSETKRDTSPAKAQEVVHKPVAPKPVERLPTDVQELEKAVEVAASLAVKEYNKAISILKNFNEDVRIVVDKAVENVDNTLWNTLRNKTSARDHSIATAEKQAHEALDKIEKIEIALSKAANAQNQALILNVRDKVKKFKDHINNVKDELYKSKDAANVSEKYWKNVEKARSYFVEEIESIFPGINISEQKLNLSKDDLDLLIMHAYSHVLAYQKELERLQTDGELRLKRAIDALRGDNDSEAVKAQLDYLLETEKRKMALENQRKIFQIRAEAEKQLRQQLKQQAEAHVDHLTDAVTLKENEMKRNFSRELEDKLESEKANYKLQLAAMLGKIRGMDAALQARAESEREAHQAQALWAACQALWATVRTGEPGVNWREQLRPLDAEIKAVSRVAEGDELVAVVLKNLPREAEQRGVFPEDALRERFLNVERLARKVALVPESGASIPMYFLSYLQSLFILTPDDPISQTELQNKEFDYSKLDTYDILNRARYYVDRGDLMQALKYMNLLQGAPRKVSSDWIKETRLLLETQQAANTLMAHAAASGLMYL